MTTATKNYEVKLYGTGECVGNVDLTDEQFRHYEAMAQQPEGIIRLGTMPHDYYNLDSEHQGLGADTVIYLE